MSDSYYVEEEHYAVKEEPDYVEDKAFLCPLLSKVELNQANCVFEAILH